MVGWMMAAGLFVSCMTAAPAGAAPARTILLVNDAGIHVRSGTRRVLRPLTRRPGNPILTADRPWEGSVAYCSVIRDDRTGRWQMWYQAYPDRAARNPLQRCVVCFAQSTDGLHWTKPALGIVPFNGDSANNIVLDGKGHYGASVVLDPRDHDPARRYKMAYWQMAPQPDGSDCPGLCVAFSPDGMHWTRHPVAPVLRASYSDRMQPPYSTDPAHSGANWTYPGSLSDVIDAAWDPVRSVWMITSKTWIDGPDGRMFWKRAVVRTDSRDFIHWSTPRLVLAPDEFDDPPSAGRAEDSSGIEFHSAPAFWYAGVYLALVQVLDLRGKGTMPAELAVSRDGWNWTRPFRGQWFLPLAPAGAFDAGCLWTNAGPVIVGDEVRFYYGAYPAWNADLTREPSGIGMASMPRERVAALRPIDHIAQVTLNPLDLRGVRAITVNADASGGAIRLELLDANGRRIRGYTRDDAVPMRGDRLGHAAAWSSPAGAALPAKRCMLRLHLEDASAYAVTLHRAPSGKAK